MHRYLALLWDPADQQAGRRVDATMRALLIASKEWETAYKANGAVVIHRAPHQLAAAIYPLTNLQGVILGSIFRRKGDTGGAPAEVGLDDSETQRILASGGCHLIDSYWGTYIAIMRDVSTGLFSVLRDPTATLACYHMNWAGVHAFFSDIEDFKRFVPAPLSINWSHVSARLLTGGTLSRETGLQEIEDVPGGERITLFGPLGERRTLLWHPGKFCVEDGLQDESKASAALRDSVINAVCSLASQHSDILVRLSGGLDSSIVTSCLAQAEMRPRVTCLNFFIGNEDGDPSRNLIIPGLALENIAKLRRVVGGADEREFARKVAHQCGFTLLERERTLEDWDFRRLWKAPLVPRPSYYVFFLDQDEGESQCAIDNRATACFTGEGGDTVFYHTLSEVGALDYAYLHPFGSGLISQIGFTSTLSRESFPRIAGKVIRHGLLRAPLPSPFDPTKRPHLMHDSAAKTVSATYFRHPWVDVAPRLCPGKRRHVIGVSTTVPAYHHVFRRDRVASSVHPLTSQPVVETCLRIPTYVLLAGGVPRGLARRAFSDLVPSEITRRTGKGMAIGFWQRLIRAHVKLIRELLLDGILVRERLLDRTKLENYLVEDQPFLSVQPSQIMDYLGCEAWLNQWTPR